MTIKTAIIDSVANSRTTLRGHLNAFPELHCESFSQPESFVKACYQTQFDLVICNFEFDNGKNSASVFCELQQSQLIPASCVKLIVTSDTSPNAISQLLDIEPDIILMRPYQIAHLHKGLKHYMAWRDTLSPHFHLLNQGKHKKLLPILDSLLTTHPQFTNEIYKLQGRLYLLEQDYAAATGVYQTVLAKQSYTLWARWGLLKSQFMSGAWEQCKRLLANLLEANIIRDKAYEWLACVAFAEAQYDEAERQLNQIKITELSLAATKLKVRLLCLQKRIDEAISLLDRKRKANTMLKEQFKELTYEMAKCYMQIAEQSPQQKHEAVESIKQLIGQIGKQVADDLGKQRRDIVLAQAHALIGETNEVKQLLEKDWMQDFSRASVDTLQGAMLSFNSVGQQEDAQMLFTLSQNKALQVRSPIDNVMQISQVETLEESIFDQETRAKTANQLGNQHFQAKEYTKAMHYFYKAKQLYPDVPAFALNLATCLHYCKQEGYREFSLNKLLEELALVKLSTDMQRRLHTLTQNYAHA